MRGTVCTKTVIGSVLGISLAIFGLSETGADYTQIVADNERLVRVFEGLDVSNPNGFQELMIQLCIVFEVCGKE
ncbi:hypothetical protein [Vibrio anguillarum]|uniref:hypothetical protein n=1 Tax=Vibrio anguillarum TaxID=55601 RepID=UPI00169C18EB|nr:hypothetical protein [Vibrio anguillarum]NOI06681.1 hypothetical protein [Vibrio anguillarum]